MSPVIVCLPKALPKDKWVAAAKVATDINPANHPNVERMAGLMPGFEPDIVFISAITTKYWHTGGVRLTVGFLDSPPAQLRTRILSHMNAWAKTANVKFTQSKTDPQVRIARAGGPDGGYWSYVGTDILTIPADHPTLNLEAFSMETPESEFHRVVRHETGHTMGFPHEHMRRELVSKIDPDKAIAFFKATQGWSEAEIRRQVLTPIEESTLIATRHADAHSIMCYQIPGSLTKDGRPILGGMDIDKQDYAFAGKLYPRKIHPAPKVPRKKR
jgi:hypothetical protein